MRGFTIRTAEEECDVPQDSADVWSFAKGAAVEVAYATADPSDRARILREYISAADCDVERHENTIFAQSLARGGGFSDREIRHLHYLRDGASPEGGWRGECAWVSHMRGLSI